MTELSKIRLNLKRVWNLMFRGVEKIYHGCYTFSYPVIRCMKSKYYLTCFVVKIENGVSCIGKQPSMLVYCDLGSLDNIQICEFPLNSAKLHLPIMQLKGYACNIEDEVFSSLANIFYKYDGSWTVEISDLYNGYIRSILDRVTEPYVSVYLSASSATSDYSTGKYVLVDSEISKGWLVC